jgi:hypothetical protein
MATIACPACKTINHLGSVACFRCRAPLPTPTPDPPMASLAEPPDTVPLPAGAPAPWVEIPQPRRGIRIPYRLAVVAVVIALAVVGVRWWQGRRSMPETLLGLPRMHTQAAQAFEGSVNIGAPSGLKWLGGWYGSGTKPQLIVGAGYSGSTPMGGSTPGEYLKTWQRSAEALVVSGEPPNGPTDIREVQRGDGSYACGLLHVAEDIYASHDGVECLWTVGLYRIGMLVWFPPDPTNKNTVSTALADTIIIAKATE